MTDIQYVKYMINYIGEELDKFDKESVPDLKGMTLRELFELELHTFLMYVATSDMNVAKAEVGIMNELFNVDFKFGDYMKFINTNEIYSSSFSTRIPSTFKITAAYDAKMMIKVGLSGKTHDALTPRIIKLYEQAGRLVANVDFNEEEEEKSTIGAYLANVANSLINALGNITKIDEEVVAYMAKHKINRE